MTHAYDNVYFDKVRDDIAVMFDYAVNFCHVPLEDFWKDFVISDVAKGYENGDLEIIAGKSGLELAGEILNIDPKKIKYEVSFTRRSEEFWVGWILCCYQWYKNVSFMSIYDRVSIDAIYSMYWRYHQMDEIRFIEDLDEEYPPKKEYTNYELRHGLKKRREEAHITQKQLAELSNIPIRTIQQYEQGQKNLGSAKATSVISLARVLNCKAEDLVL